MPKEDGPALVLYTFMAGLIGARLGYLFINQPLGFLCSPVEVFNPRLGGMNFHGANLAMAFMALLYCRFKIKPFLELADIGAVCLPLLLMCVRIGNYLNGELFGTVTTLPWGVVFPMGGDAPRHPTQMYEALLEGPALFGILWWFRTKSRNPGQVWAVFLIGYGMIRFMIEFIQEPITRIISTSLPLTIGQVLCALLIALGTSILFISRKFYNDNQRQLLGWYVP